MRDITVTVWVAAISSDLQCWVWLVKECSVLSVNRCIFLRNLPLSQGSQAASCLPGGDQEPFLIPTVCVLPSPPPAVQHFCHSLELHGVDGAPSGACPEFFHDLVTRIAACPPLSQQHCIPEMVLQMSDGGWAQGIGLVEFLAECLSPH